MQLDRGQELVEIEFLLRGDFNLKGVAAHAFHDDLIGQQIGSHPYWIGARLVDLVDGDDERHARRLGVVDGFHRLRHYAVVGSHHKHDDVRDLCAARTHRGKSGVAWRIDEGDGRASRRANLISADMLRNAASFASDHVGLTDGVKQRGLAVIDVAHDGDDRCPGQPRLRRIGLADEAFLDIFLGDTLHGVAEFRRDQLRRIGVDHVVDLQHLSLLHQELDDIDGALRHAVGELLDRDRLG